MAKRNFPKHTLEDSLAVAQKIQDESAGKPYNRLLLAQALGIKPSSTNYRDLLSSSFKYGLTEGTEKANEISLTEMGRHVVQETNSKTRMRALRQAALTPPVFKEFFETYANHKVPSPDMIDKILVSKFGIPEEFAGECADIVMKNGAFVDIIRDIGGSPHVLLGAQICEESEALEGEGLDAQDTLNSAAETVEESDVDSDTVIPAPKHTDTELKPRAIFISHGKKKAPLEKLQKILTSFQIPYKIAVDEANLGRPISKKVKDIMTQCGSAILLFTCDEKLFSENQEEVWRPSENVVHELGAASFAYEERVVIFKEKGLALPTNFRDIGYIEFDEDGLEAKATELLKELIGFGLIKITPVS